MELLPLTLLNAFYHKISNSYKFGIIISKSVMDGKQKKLEHEMRCFNMVNSFYQQTLTAIFVGCVFPFLYIMVWKAMRIFSFTYLTSFLRLRSFAFPLGNIEPLQRLISESRKNKGQNDISSLRLINIADTLHILILDV